MFNLKSQKPYVSKTGLLKQIKIWQADRKQRMFAEMKNSKRKKERKKKIIVEGRVKFRQLCK